MTWKVRANLETAPLLGCHMASPRRDDFPASVKTMAASRVGWRCSNPECQVLTIAATLTSSGVVKAGQACHIRAAAPGGPRYDPDQSVEGRRSLENAIWLCTPCSGRIDTDWASYPVDVIELWRYEAEDLARRELARRPDGNQRRSLRFTVIRIDTAVSAWRPAWRFRQAPTRFGFHQLDLRRLRSGAPAATQTLDPVFDITVLNDGDVPLHVHRVGFLPSGTWSDVKGIEQAQKIVRLDSYRLEVAPIVDEEPQTINLPDPVQVNAGSPFRFGLHLAGYRGALSGNESVVRFMLESDAGPHLSRLVYLGVY